MANALQPGLLALHGNRTEDLASVMASFIRRHPLGPLETEVILTQSNGMAEWVKMTLAGLGGVCAATDVMLPSRFLWRTYRQILGADAVPVDSALDKTPMTWRLMQLLPGLLGLPDFAPIASLLAADAPDRMLQLATQLADLFDQYQNYRADWLLAWAGGDDILILGNGAKSSLPPEQMWQPQLWRAVLQTLDEQDRHCTRPAIQRRVLAHLATGTPLAGPVARRVIVFGMSQIPYDTLQTLAALAAHSQIILAIPNPCRFDWGGIMDGRELLRASRRRHPSRCGLDLSAVPLQDMHLHAHPLLAAWGRQGRDFVRLLDDFDDAQRSLQTFDLPRIDLFDEAADDACTPWLKQVQNRIRDLSPLAEHPLRVDAPAGTLAADDLSFVFHTAHSAVRELEILQDQLLQLLATTTAVAVAGGTQAVQPRDVIVMVPDIERMAPAIRAVFGQYPRHDARFIPFDIADMSAKTTSPLIGLADWLLRLPALRCGMSDLVGLLEIPAVAARFGVNADDLPTITQWLAGAGVRWGLNTAHRAGLGLAACGLQNTALFGLRRMLMGYACGATGGVADIAPYAEVAGLQAELAGSLAHLIDALSDWLQTANTLATPDVWADRCRQLLASVAQACSDTDRQALQALDDGLMAWQDACEQAGFVALVPVTVVRLAWMEATQIPAQRQRFRAGGITFCTLMPMRAIPFDVVCLLGMNDGDYPRRSTPNDFDLMGLPGAGRAGDRSRRDDDRQLMLEALLSARRMLYVSWCGHSVRDNSALPPSVLVSQLRDYLAAGWGQGEVDRRTTHHPLQPFSRRYFEAGSLLFTHATEWRSAHSDGGTGDGTVTTDTTSDTNSTDAVPVTWASWSDVPVTQARLVQFLRYPVRTFFRHRLQVSFESDTTEVSDLECFGLDGLQKYSLILQLLTPLAADTAAQDQAQAHDQGDVSGCVQQALEHLRKTGVLPLGGFGQLAERSLAQDLIAILQSWRDALARYPVPSKPLAVRLSAKVGDAGDAGHLDEGISVVLEDWVDRLRAGAGIPSDTAWLDWSASNLLNAKKSDTKAQIRHDKLLAVWVRSLVCAASGLSVRGVLVGRDGVIEVAPMPCDTATQTLTTLLRLWHGGMAAPLPLPLKTSLAWVTGNNPMVAYQGGYDQNYPSDVDELCMARIYPDYAALCACGRFERLATEIYQPLIDWAKTYVTARLHDPA